MSYSDKFQNSNKHKVSLRNTRLKDTRIKDKELKKYLSNHNILLASPVLEIIKIILVIICLIVIILSIFLSIFLLILRTDGASKRRLVPPINAINEGSLDKNNSIIRRPMQPYSALVKSMPLFNGESIRPPLSSDRLQEGFFRDMVTISNNLEEKLKGGSSSSSMEASVLQKSSDQSSDGSFNSSTSETNTLNSCQNDIADRDNVTSSERSNNSISSTLEAKLRIILQSSGEG